MKGILQTLCGAFMGEVVNPDPTTYWTAGGHDFTCDLIARRAAQAMANRTGRSVSVVEHAPGHFPFIRYEAFPQEQPVTYALDPL